MGHVIIELGLYPGLSRYEQGTDSRELPRYVQIKLTARWFHEFEEIGLINGLVIHGALCSRDLGHSLTSVNGRHLVENTQT